MLEFTVIRMVDGVLETFEDDRGDAVARSEPDGFTREIGHAEIHGRAMTGIIAGSSENESLANAAVSQLNGRRNVGGQCNFFFALHEDRSHRLEGDFRRRLLRGEQEGLRSQIVADGLHAVFRKGSHQLLPVFLDFVIGENHCLESFLNASVDGKGLRFLSTELLRVLGVEVLEVFAGHAEDAAEAFGIVVRERTFVLDDGFDLGDRDAGGGGELQQAHAVAFNEIALKDLAKRFERGGGIGHSCSPKRRAPDWPGVSLSSNAFGPRAQDFVPALASIKGKDKDSNFCRKSVGSRLNFSLSA